jgi:hypothetical protein
MESSGRIELPAAFEDAHIDQLALLIADMLDRLMAHNDRIPLLPVLDYLKRIVKFTNVEKSCLLITLHYIDQICARMPLFTLSSLTCHRFVIASITVASKGLCDTFCTNSLYAKVGGISVSELNVLEREFLQAIDWRLMCTREVLQEYFVNLVRTHSASKFIITGTQSSGSVSSDSQPDIDTSSSHCNPGVEKPARIRDTHHRPTSETSPFTPEVPLRPTIEQNVAFAALQERRESED